MTGAQNSFANGESYSASGYIDTAGTSFSAPLAAGAAAVLKGARPGLTQQQYRSLLINSASAATKDANTPAGVQLAGAGVLESGRSYEWDDRGLSYIAEFWNRHGHASETLSLSVFNTGTAAGTYTIVAVSSGAGPVRSLSNNFFRLEPNHVQPLLMTIGASGLTSGEYQG